MTVQDNVTISESLNIYTDFKQDQVVNVDILANPVIYLILIIPASISLNIVIL